MAAMDEKKFMQKAKEYRCFFFVFSFFLFFLYFVYLFFSKMKRVLAVVTREKTLVRINAQKKVKGKGKAVTVLKTSGPGKAKKSFKKKEFNNKKSDNGKDDE